ncbi:BMP and activin membrane-bound inhibitor homolog isoform X2 [Hypanus sabinus]|uniref:BMP and activin membrane-bound inhibitor homolog isoform X2 n=1 Tax=Hypanus sabinus TaxID=79690 RepID=UPI0028C42671|nr:BMP and activin membrane-bound inhibitor homolog isoform X2 [Hypanus sabinus]
MDRHPTLMAVWLQLELCVISILFTKGEIRCYCDGPQCVATGYMYQGAKKQRNSGNMNLAYQQKANTKEIWFRAAVIAVCIAGAFILVLLVVLALRMLRSENERLQRQHEQMISRLHYSFQEPPSEKVLVGNLDFESTVTIARDHENCCMVHNQQQHFDPY